MYSVLSFEEIAILAPKSGIFSNFQKQCHVTTHMKRYFSNGSFPDHVLYILYMKNDQFFALLKLIPISTRFDDFNFSVIVGAPAALSGPIARDQGQIVGCPQGLK